MKLSTFDRVLLIVSIALIGLSAYTLVLDMKDNKNVGDQGGSSGYTTAITGTGVLVTSSSGTVIATSTSATTRRIDNIGSKPIFCKLDRGYNAVAYEGITIFASTSVEFSDTNGMLYRGAINCIAPLGNASTTVYQK